ncbi:MAG TPA: DUF2442 domain-containing protein [Coleofasciculaceae cyanobacterium]|jgi:hypothetical protein
MATRDWAKEVSDDFLDKQIERAKAAWIKAEETELRAKSATYDRRSKLLIVKLNNGAEFRLPPHLIEGLSEASVAQIADVHLSGTGDSIHWEKLNIDFSISGLVSGILGTKAWMSELGRKGGKKSTSAKSAAAKENGKKGGRPRKTTGKDSGVVLTKGAVGVECRKHDQKSASRTRARKSELVGEEVTKLS